MSTSMISECKMGWVTTSGALAELGRMTGIDMMAGPSAMTFV